MMTSTPPAPPVTLFDFAWSILASVDFWKITIPIGLAVLTWALNERSKRKWEYFKIKNEIYGCLLENISGFSIDNYDQAKIGAFITQLQLCWAIAPDSVINSAYGFIDTIHAGRKSTDEQKEAALGNLVYAIRMDMLKSKMMTSTKLTGKDFRYLKSNQKQSAS